MRVPLAKPDITQYEIDEVVGVLKSGVLSIGPKVEEFERKVANYIGVRFAVAVNSGTSGLHCIVKSLKLGRGDEVITSSFSFVASANCLMMEGAVPVFADIDPRTLNMDINCIEEKITERTKAILAVDVFGQPMDMRSLRRVADRYKLHLIEDSCEAIGSQYYGDKAGTVADASVFAFYPNKQITTGEGGIIVTNDGDIVEMCRSLRSQGRAITGFWLHHERLGYNYRMSELQAALGCAQMDRIDEIIKKRQKAADMYNERLSGIEGLSLPYVAPEVTAMSWFVYVVRLDRNIDRDNVMNYLKSNGVGCRPYFTPIHVQPYMVEMFGYREEDYPYTSDAGRRCMALPFYNNISRDEIEYVAEKLEEAIKLSVIDKVVPF